MSRLHVRLFGRLSVSRDDTAVDGLAACKVQELLAYLLLHRDRTHSRETLAGLLWGDCPTPQSKKYLRQALWQLQAALGPNGEPPNARTLSVDSDNVRLNTGAAIWLDIAKQPSSTSSSRCRRTSVPWKSCSLAIAGRRTKVRTPGTWRLSAAPSAPEHGPIVEEHTCVC